MALILIWLKFKVSAVVLDSWISVPVTDSCHVCSSLLDHLENRSSVTVLACQYQRLLIYSLHCSACNFEPLMMIKSIKVLLAMENSQFLEVLVNGQMAPRQECIVKESREGKLLTSW